ncbi:dUTP diphosphatase [Candidatus Uabimicrobium sp. HlEnr_7]|uniref:dUTP diphosphatase n=1 Tax=Candidatus Uabimicrobium helgolandensis TaxID=3095367 RepID=UPI003555ED50
MNKVQLFVERIDDSLPLPQYQTVGAAGIDLYIRDSLVLQPKQRGFFPSNIKMAIPDGYYVTIMPRSSSFKLGINIFKGTIDSDFRKEVHIGIENATELEIILEKGQRIAQAIIHKVEQVKLTEAKVEDNDRGGFGSTGK